MNLLSDAWIPVQHEGKRQLIGLQEVLCTDTDWSLSLPRDDMELACLQLMICLVQVIFVPPDAKTLKQRIRQPLAECEYQETMTPYLDWFDLNHPDTPFMQVRGVESIKETPIQKMFIGLPGGNNHCFFNDIGEVKTIGESAAAIVLFNQTVNSPDYSNGLKTGLLGISPITTLIQGDSLKQTIWLNVLHEGSLRRMIVKYDELKASDKPTWVEPIKAKSSISSSDIGLLRGLFWQPRKVELIYFGKNKSCDFLGIDTNETITGFKADRLSYERVGFWLHPHAPYHWKLKNDEKEPRYLSFSKIVPAWTQLTHFTLDESLNNNREGYQTATVVRQYREEQLKKIDFYLKVGGYSNKSGKSIVEQRRHELIGLSGGWEDNLRDIKETIETALQIKTALRSKLYGFAKASGAHAVPKQAETLFYHQSEMLIHESLRKMDWRAAKQARGALVRQLIQLSWAIFGQVTQPYQHEAKMILAIAVTKRTLGAAFKKIKGELA